MHAPFTLLTPVSACVLMMQYCEQNNINTREKQSLKKKQPLEKKMHS
jgi:hypothetical protein